MIYSPRNGFFICIFLVEVFWHGLAFSTIDSWRCMLSYPVFKLIIMRVRVKTREMDGLRVYL